MAEEQFKITENPWLEVAKMYSPNKMDCLYGENNYFCEGDRDAIENYNKKASGTTDEIITKIPAEPWWGNPLKARLIILSLNPGYVPEVNKTLALLMQTNETVRRQLIEYKAQTLRLEAEAFLPEDEKNEDCCITCNEAVNMLGDWYWVDKLRELREAYVERRKNENARISDIELENEFYKKIAVVEYCAYTSQNFSDSKLIEGLPSVEYVKDLVRYIESEGKALFVILRAERKWEKVLSDNTRCIVNTNLSQNLSRKNLNSKKGAPDKSEKAPFDVILDKLLEK